MPIARTTLGYHGLKVRETGKTLRTLLLAACITGDEFRKMWCVHATYRSGQTIHIVARAARTTATRTVRIESNLFMPFAEIVARATDLSVLRSAAVS